MKLKKKILSNGLRVISIPEADALAATVLVLVETGSKYETKKINGISHFLEHMCFKGTTKRPKALGISSELDSLGAQFNAFTGQEYTGYYAKVQPGQFTKALELVADLYLDPLFDAAEIEKEKGVIIEEINMYEDMPSRRVAELLFGLVYGDQPAGWNIAGEKDVIRSMTRENFIRYRADHYVASATTVIVAGKFDEKKVFSLVEKYFRGMSTGRKHPKKKTVDRQTKPEALVRYKKSDQTHLALAVRSYPLSHKDTFVLEVLAGVLGGGMSSRLFQTVREEMGAAYYVRASNDAYTDHGLFEVSAGVDHRKCADVIRAILSEMKKLTRDLVSQAELQKVKDSIIGHLYLGLEKSDEIANFFGGQEVLRQELKTPELVAKKIQTVTADQLRAVARKIFLTKHLNLALIGPFEDKAPFVKLLDLS